MHCGNLAYLDTKYIGEIEIGMVEVFLLMLDVWCCAVHYPCTNCRCKRGWVSLTRASRYTSQTQTQDQKSWSMGELCKTNLSCKTNIIKVPRWTTQRMLVAWSRIMVCFYYQLCRISTFVEAQCAVETMNDTTVGEYNIKVELTHSTISQRNQGGRVC